MENSGSIIQEKSTNLAKNDEDNTLNDAADLFVSPSITNVMHWLGGAMKITQSDVETSEVSDTCQREFRALFVLKHLATISAEWFNSGQTVQNTVA